MITYLLNTLVDSIKTSLINKLGLDPSTEVDLDDFPQLIDDIPILDSVEELTVTQNGTYTGTDGVTYNPVNVNLPLGSKSVTANGTYTASDDSLQGYSSVTVDIDDTDLYRDTIDSTYESVKTLSNCGAFPMLSLTAEINAVQDLHGYDHPWAGGAGKNLLAPLTEPVTKKGITITPQSDGSVILNGTKTEDNNPITISTQFTLKSNTYTVSIGTYPSTIADYGFSGYGTAKTVSRTTEFITAVQVYINQGTTVNNVVLYPQIELGETATPYSPYSNICPITGWDEVNVSVSGVNVWDEEWELGSIDGTTGANVVSSTNFRSKNYISVIPNLSYCFYYGSYSTSNPFTTLVCLFYDLEKNYISNASIVLDTRAKSVTIPSNAHYLRFRSGGTNAQSTYNNDISINYPSTDTEYHAYNGNTYTTALSTTCYGGSKDIKGNEIFTHGHIASYNGETLPSTWISDRDEYAEGTTPTVGAEVVYELATPTTATSDAIDLTLAEGVNNLWASSGDVGDARYFRKVEL